MNKKTVITIVVVVVVIVIIAVLVSGNHGASSTANAPSGGSQTQQTQQPAASPAYTSSADGFTVGFPGTPTVGNKTFQSPTAGSVSETDYTFISSANGKGILYMVMVIHYPATYRFSSDYLTGALQMFSKIIDAKYPGATVVSQGQSQFLGGAAISGSVVVPFMGAPTPGNVLITTKNQNTYVVSAYGLSQSDYNTFLNSFSFSQ
jgi:hypothetical protein